MKESGMNRSLKKYFQKISLMMIGLGVFGIASASTEQDLANLLRKKYPNTTVDQVIASPVPNIYEVDMGRNVAYTTPDGKYMFFGLMDIEAGKDLTALRKEELNRISFSSLPLKKAIKDVRGNGRATLAVFSDPECKYCKKLESELLQLKDVTIYTFPFPILGATSTRKAVNVWCSSEPARNWSIALTAGKIPPDIDCKNPISENVALGNKLGIFGTPTMISSDGRILQGAVSAVEINKWLEQVKN